MQSLGLILYELGTNATKHGALSVEAGRVAVDWTWQESGVVLTWIESGGPTVGPSMRKGFGQVVFERIGAALDGAISTEFRPDGLVCAITIGASNLLPAE